MSEQAKSKRRTRGEVLRDTERMLGLARRGLDELNSHDGEAHLPGIANIAAFGVATTQTLQNLSSISEAFAEWYAPERAALKADPVARYFWELRVNVLKKGEFGAINPQVNIEAGTIVSFDRIAADMPPAPPGATGFKFGDDLGGSGWVVPMADGTEQLFYVAVPEGYPIQTTLHFDDPPPLPDGADGDSSVQALAQHYVSTLATLVARARERFG